MPTSKAECSCDAATLTARDVARIATTLEIEPVRFCVRTEATRPSDTAFALQPGARRWELCLRRRQDEDAKVCVFSMRLPSGRRLCSLGGLAPAFCAYPRPNHDAAEAARVRAREVAQHTRAVGAWNALVERSGVPHPLEFFLDHLLNVCANEPTP